MPDAGYQTPVIRRRQRCHALKTHALKTGALKTHALKTGALKTGDGKPTTAIALREGIR